MSHPDPTLTYDDETTEDKYTTDWFIELMLTKTVKELNKAREGFTDLERQPYDERNRKDASCDESIYSNRRTE